jgi:nucleotide-binding universal stress UspA family protein
VSGGITHILCGVDGSAPACVAAERAADLALALGARLTFVAVARAGTPDPALVGYMQAEGLGEEPVPLLPEAAERCLSVALIKASGKGYTGAARLVRVGRVAETLIVVAGEIGADTIAIGRHRHSGLRRVMFGSIAQEIADRTSHIILSYCC